ncbi:MAG: threonine ammonia-lyase, partial [Bdellovibrionales bacterium]|nr:threonine ammonia-lyase [Bdellovibrionales bacterium]
MASEILAVSISDIEKASQRISSCLEKTPVSYSPIFSERFGREVYFKWDNRFRTGAFKERGAANLLGSLSDDEAKRGVCAASMGNHALALSWHAAKKGIPCTIVMPIYAPLVKVQSTKNTGATVFLEGETLEDATVFAKELVAKHGHRFVSAYDDELIIAGQGTAGLEILDQCPDVDSIVVPVGGGGLISGIATAVKAKRPDVYILGVQSEWVSWMAQAKQEGSVAPVQRSIADGIAVKTLGKLTRPIVEQKVDSLLTVSEEDIAKAVVDFVEVEHAVVEGAGAAGLAAISRELLPSKFKKTVVMVGGSNIDGNLLTVLIERDLVKRGRWIKVPIAVPDRPGQLNRVSKIIAEQGANVLHVRHDRFSTRLGIVDILFLIEVRDRAHGNLV